jgi:hypothetical protein
MTINELLHLHAETIVREAEAALERAHLPNYQKAGKEHTHQRIKGLFVLTARAVKERNVGPMIAHANAVAEERFAAGYDLAEVQTAFNVLEEVVWRYIMKELAPEQLAEALGLVGTVLGAGKDALARKYVSLASKNKAPSLNLQSLFAGTDN